MGFDYLGTVLSICRRFFSAHKAGSVSTSVDFVFYNRFFNLLIAGASIFV